MSAGKTLSGVAAILFLAACADTPTGPDAAAYQPTVAASQSATALKAGGRAYLPGEQQPLAMPLSGTWAIYPEGVGQNLTQSFTPTENQWLGYLEIPVGCTAGVLLDVKIRDGVAGPILYESNHAGLPEIVDGAFQLLQVYNPATSAHGIKLHKNHTYAFELAAFPGPDATGNTCGIAKGPSGNSYPGGRGYYSDLSSSTTWLPLPNGVATDDEDLPFITLVR